MAHLHRIVEATQVGDDRDAEGAYAAVVGHDDLRDGRHAYGVAAQRAVHPILCGRLEGWPLHTDVDTVLHLDAFLLGDLVSQCHESEVIGLVHIRESWSRGEVLSAQRVLGEEVDVVGDDHQVANLELRVHASGGVADEQRLDAQFVHHPHGEGDLLHRVALVVVESPLHGHDVHASQFAEDQFAGMALNG